MIVHAPLKPDKNGYIGQQCPLCHKVFKVQFRTGSSGPLLYCPYCRFQGSSWYTKEQRDYLETVAQDYPKKPPAPPDESEPLVADQIFLKCGHGDAIQHDDSQSHLYCICCGEVTTPVTPIP